MNAGSDDRPVALLLPALSSISARAEMLPLESRLAPRWRCVIPDWPGFGDAPRTRRRTLGPDTLRGFLDDLIQGSVRGPALGIAAGHAAPYLVEAASRHPCLFARLVLIAPTWRGPLPTMFGPSRQDLAPRARKAFDLPVLGPLLYRAATSRRMIEKMMRAHVYADPALVTPELVEAKLHVVRQPDARFGTAAFISGGLDPVASRAGFLALFADGLPPTLLLRPSQAPPRSAAEMDALAATGRVVRVTVPGALAAYEEHPDAVAQAIDAFLMQQRSSIDPGYRPPA